MSAPAYKPRLAALELFRDAVWGNKHIFTERVTRRQSEPNPRIVEYLDFGEHRGAVRSICSAMRAEKLLLIQEYREAMNNFRIDDQNYELGACILGQPGIGKSCFIAYAVVELLRERQPVAVQVTWDQDRPHYILLSENGVHHYDHTAVGPLTSYPGIWAFSDSNEFVRIPTVAFTDTPGVRTFQTTSPSRKRHKEWTKQTGVLLYFMDIWPAEEIEDLAFIFGLDVNHVSKLAERWGPVPRTLLRFCRMPEEEAVHQRTVEYACALAAQEPDAVIQPVTNFSGPLDLGLSILFVKPRGKDIVHRSDYFVFVPTRWLLSRLGKRLISEADNTRVNFFNIMSGYYQTCSAAGWIFKEHIHCYILGQQSITINWHDERPQIFNLPHLQVCTNLDDVKHTPPSYWRPKEEDFHGIDGVIVTAECIYLMQVTIGRKHSSPQDGVDRVWKLAPALRSLKWKFLFIGSSEDRIKAVSQKYADKLEVEKAEVKEQKKKKRKILKGRLPVGRVSIFPASLEFRRFDLLGDDEPKESDTCHLPDLYIPS